MEVTKDYISDLLDKYSDMVLRIAYTYLKNRADAEDIVQDVFLRIIDKKPSFNDESHEKSWLNMFWNKNKCSIDDVQEFAVSDKYNTDTSVFQAVMALGEKYRVVVYMYYYEGYSTPEIADVIGKNETTIRSLLHRARNKLKDMLKEDYDFE